MVDRVWQCRSQSKGQSRIPHSMSSHRIAHRELMTGHYITVILHSISHPVVKTLYTTLPLPLVPYQVSQQMALLLTIVEVRVSSEAGSALWTAVETTYYNLWAI